MRGLVADTELETSRAPVDELDGALGLEGGDSGVGIVGDDVAAVQKASGHVLSVAGIALDHLVVGLEAGHGHLLDRVGLVGSLGGRDNGSISNQGEVDAGIRHQVGLELIEIDVEGAIETEGGGNGRDDYQARKFVSPEFLCHEIKNRNRPKHTLSNQTVQVLVVGALKTQVATADIVDSLVVDHEGAVGVLEGGMGGQDRVVRLNDRSGGLGGGVDAELQLALLAVVN